jgi:hypothetical protein
MSVSDLVTSVYEKKKQVDLIILGFSKTFDKVNHEEVLLKMHDFGIRGQTLRWAKRFLDNRLQSLC